jgi:hypothetical protein
MLEKRLKIDNAIEGTKLNKLEKSLGEINTTKVITYLLMRFSDNFNVGKNITSVQASIMAIDIIEKYPYETIEDVILLLKYVRQGVIGDGKDFKLDGQNVLAKWFPEYLDKKYAEVERLNKANPITETTTSNNAVEQFYKKRRDDKFKKEQSYKIRLQVDEMVKNMDRQMLEDTILDWSKDEKLSQHIDYLKQKRQIMQ